MPQISAPCNLTWNGSMIPRAASGHEDGRDYVLVGSVELTQHLLSRAVPCSAVRLELSMIADHAMMAGAWR